ncbi:hypothetical protein EV196_105331 [Mariniflexile fucanivorans]|uniref:Outer membrane protein with beta-barrel domain n=1 Tax=Mariniflexile fucanivorans TaxID=264023 RepID=A0A4R1RHU7_9FLAO|nr:hypothetical protein [Mariniflexile fucanivorans]TCL65665.1 hypothetical protein EV196_105331 [Mariniflexile fucanivorans]
MNFKTPFFILFFLVSIQLFSQSDENTSKRKIEIGTELQVYPVGYMTMITSNIFIKEDLALRFRLGGNFANREDFSGFNDDEVAEGFGGSFGLVKYVSYWKGNFIFGASLDTWNMWTKWKDGINTSNPTSGTTYNLVIQPWVNAGYLYNLSNKWNAGISVGLGREINIITRGENVGEGWMGIATFSLNYILN